MRDFISGFLMIVGLSCIESTLRGDDFFHRPESIVATPAKASGSYADDTQIIERIIGAYRKNTKEQAYAKNSMWDQFYNQNRAIHSKLLFGQFHEIAEILRNPGQSDLFYGFDALNLGDSKLFQSAEKRLSHAIDCLERLIRCAEAFWDHPSTDIHKNRSHTIPAVCQADLVINAIDRALGVTLQFPNPFPMEEGVLSSHGVISYRVPQAIYKAWRIKQIVKDISKPRVLEIGAGLGRTAFYARQLGIEDYTIVDLPFSAVSSGYFLGRVLGADQILLSGESSQDSSRRIKIITPSEFLNSNEVYDLIINVDGFTEMNRAIAEMYFDRIEKNGNLFLSINHELNSYTVKELAARRRSINSVDRFPYCMREGYMEELVHFNKNNK